MWPLPTSRPRLARSGFLSPAARQSAMNRSASGCSRTADQATSWHATIV